MSFQEKRIIVSIICGISILGAYIFYTYGKVQAGVIAENDMKFWAVTMLMFVGIGIVSSIIIQIVFHIAISIGMAIKEQIVNGSVNDKEIERTIEAEMVSDERDKLIEMKSTRVGFAVAGFGFIAALISLVLNYSPAVMMNILFISFSVGSVLEGFTQLFFYRRGV